MALNGIIVLAVACPAGPAAQPPPLREGPWNNDVIAYRVGPAGEGLTYGVGVPAGEVGGDFSGSATWGGFQLSTRMLESIQSR